MERGFTQSRHSRGKQERKRAKFRDRFWLDRTECHSFILRIVPFLLPQIIFFALRSCLPFYPTDVSYFFPASSLSSSPPPLSTTSKFPPPPPTYTPTRQSAISLFVKYTLVESNRSVGYKKSMNTFIGFPLLVLLLLASLLAWFVGRYHFLAKTPSSCSWPSFPSSLLLVEGRPTLQASSSLGPQMLCG